MAKRFVMALFGTMGAGAAPLVVFAAPPMAYDRWSVNNGTISAQCAGGVACGNGVSGPGMLQRPVDNGTGKFIQSIMTNPNATGTPATLSFSSESFVRQGWTSSDTVNGDTTSSTQSDAGGIALKQRMVETGNPLQGDFNLTTLIHTGWADDNNTPTVEINQRNGSNLAVVQWSNDFVYKQNVNAASTVTGLSLDIDQLGINLRNFDPIKAKENHPNDVMRYVQRRRAGDMNPGRLGGGVSGEKDGPSVPAFTAGGDAQVTWFGMYYYGEPGPNTSIGYQAYDNLLDTRSGSSNMERKDAPGRPWSWDNMFGAMPTMPFPPPGGKGD